MRLSEVFGVSAKPVASYIERQPVDAALEKALAETRQVIVYGSSKQGKTALLQRHIPANSRVTVLCTPKMAAEDIYRALLRQQNVEIITEKSSGTSRELGASVSAKFKAVIPFFGTGEASTRGDAKAGTTEEVKTETIEFNLGLAQDVGELLRKIERTRVFHVLENFHYLSDDVQRQLAFDIRSFEEISIRFVILGVWRERNRLVQFNGDLQDRIAEVPVEPWTNEDFERIVELGQSQLNVDIDQEIKKCIFHEAHGSVAVVQELLKAFCEKSGITETVSERRTLDDSEALEDAINDKVTEYASRHVRSLESIAAGSRTRRATEVTTALFLPYYLVLVMVNCSFIELKEGLERRTVLKLIKERHENPDGVRVGDVSSMLSRLSALQADAKIQPPLFDYDRGTRRLKVVDSTLYFFIDNCDPVEVMEGIPHPDPTSSTATDIATQFAAIFTNVDRDVLGENDES